jgi:mannose-1-phosphate guanylyltransferase
LRAFLLAAGKGTRLRPLTDRIPKCLVEIGGRPMLGLWLDALARAGVEDVLVNTHHLADQVRAYVVTRGAQPPRVTLFHEPELLGSAGTVAANRAWIGPGDFLVVYADNLTRFDPRRLIEAHRRRGALFTLGLFRAAQPRECGIAELDAEDRVVRFEEKPAHPRSEWANAGIYMVNPAVLDELPAKVPCDFGYDLLPRLAGRMHGFRIDEPLHDIGTPERLEAARAEWTRSAGGST